MGTHIEDHNDGPCAAVPHVVGNISLVRCTHRESVTATAWVSSVDGNDDTEPLMMRQIQFGPFDSRSEIVDQLVDMLFAAAAVALPEGVASV